MAAKERFGRVDTLINNAGVCRGSKPPTKYSFLNRLLAVGTGEISADGPVHVIEEAL